MNEASSKYVDRIATEKLINEKLNRVHHAPDALGYAYDTTFDDFDSLPLYPQDVIETRGENAGITFLSAVQTGYEENDVAKCRLTLSEESAGHIIFVHGLYEDSIQIYNFFISMLKEQGMNVYLLTLPFHYERKPKKSLFSGEFFWSGDIHRNALALKQSVYDLCQLYRHLKCKSRQEVWIVGFSMGGGIALSLASLMAIDGVFTINPVCNITKLLWTSALFSPIKKDLETNGFTFDDIKARYRSFEPLDIAQVKTARDKVVLAKGIYDQINDTANYDLLVARWNIKHVLSYKAGHLNLLRVPKLAIDVTRFYFGGQAK